MCGIAGLWGRGNIHKMIKALSHRGPDGVGFYKGEKVHLAAQSLKITDPSGGNRPFYNEDKSICVVLNGEIYNYKVLQQELLSKGHQFRSQSDGEVIVHLYEEEGENCLEKLEGMFAFALWDNRNKKLLRAAISARISGKKYGLKLELIQGLPCLLAVRADSHCLSVMLSSFLLLSGFPVRLGQLQAQLTSHLSHRLGLGFTPDARYR